MRLNWNKVWITIAIIVAIQILAGLWALSAVQPQKLDVVLINELCYQCIDQWEALIAGSHNNMPLSPYAYTVLDKQGNLLYSSEDTASVNITEAIQHRATILDLMDGEQMLGKLILINNNKTLWRAVSRKIFVILLCGSMISVLLVGGVYWYLDRNVFAPFSRLQGFAARVAEGNLDLPLEMERNNIFGAFTESFDMMRSELKKSRERELAAERSKKELVAQLSHDIKTPLASIKAITEVMALQVQGEKVLRQLTVIEEKADQANELISNLFHGTLEELNELKVTPELMESQKLMNIICNADYQERAALGRIPDCLVSCDRLRLQQVFDNLFANSYKYANTEIYVDFALYRNMLTICLTDHGPGVLKEELPYLSGKFYRGKNASDKDGAGLGLYISAYLMERMGGTLTYENMENGFRVKLGLKI